MSSIYLNILTENPVEPGTGMTQFIESFDSHPTCCRIIGSTHFPKTIHMEDREHQKSFFVYGTCLRNFRLFYYHMQNV